MLRRFVVSMGILALSISMFAQTKQSKPDPDNSVSQALKAIEQTWLTAEKNNDTKAFEKLVADDWIAITPDGKSQTKAERAEEVKNGHIESASLGNMKVRVFGSTAVVTGTDDETATVDGKKSTSHYVWTDVFVKREGNWVAVASQTAQLK